MRPPVYIETSIVSYYTGRLSRDLVIAGRQQVTRDWWDNQRRGYSLYVSAVVLQEARKGDASAVRSRARALRGIPILPIGEEAEELARWLVRKGPIPKECPEDALHIAVASANGMDFLMTWNFRHINNAQTKSAVTEVVEEFGFECPVICTPEELAGE